MPDDEVVDAEPIRVMIVDDHGVVRQGLRSYLGIFPDVVVVAEAADGGEAVSRIDQLVTLGQAPDVVVMDLAMTPVSGVEATRIIRSRWPQIEVVALTSFVEATRVNEALDAGASGYLIKDAAPEELVLAVRAARRGEIHLDPAITRRMMSALRGGVRPLDRLTEREREVLTLVARGMNNADIGRQLHTTERTARTHVSNILRKLGVASRTQAALLAVREGLT